MKIVMKINEISSKVLSKVKSQISHPLLNLKRILEDNKEIWKKLSQLFVWVSLCIRCKSPKSICLYMTFAWLSDSFRYAVKLRDDLMFSLCCLSI